MKSYIVVVALIAGGAWVSACPARAASPHRHKVHPRIRAWLAVPWVLAPGRQAAEEGSGAPGAPGGALAGRRAPRLAPISIRFRELPAGQTLERLSRAGVAFLPAFEGPGPLHVDRLFPARAEARSLAALEEDPEVEQVDLDLLVHEVRPLDTTAAEIGAPAVWAMEKDGVPLTGKGLAIGVIDAGVDIFHPAFFREDGGLYAWIDANANGRFDPGTDAVDLDADGKAGAKETLKLLDAQVIGRPSYKPILGSKNGTYEIDTDWLYLDQNGNGSHDYGPSSGATDGTPGFGEPLFVGEDLNRNGKLDPEEKLARLKTSKVRAFYHAGVERKRGTNLSASPVEKESYHGTATSGVLVAGSRPYRRWVGIVPEADLLMATSSRSSSSVPFSALPQWLAQSKAQVVLHEYAPWTGYHLDGSSNHEALMDQLSKQGIAQVTPAGNLAGIAKHALTTVAAGNTKDLLLDVPGPSSVGTHYYMNLTLLWRQTATSLELTLKDPLGLSETLPTDNTGGKYWRDGSTAYVSFRQDSARGTAMMDITLYNGTQTTPGKLSAGTWTLSVRNPSSAGSVTLHAYTMDALTSWQKGIGWQQDVSDEGTVCWPATADSAIALGAYAAHVGLPYEEYGGGEKQGALRKYSSRGQRVDGAQILSLAAPDNPITPATAITSLFPHASHFVFGGTSGAGPHVAGAALLVKQHQPALDGVGVRAALRQGALADSQVGSVPSTSWGYGKLRVHRALYGKDPTANTRPTAKIVVEGRVVAGTPTSLRPEVKDAEDAEAKLVVRWDDGYDGTWDTGFGPVQARQRTFSASGPARVKLQVKDSGGLIGEAALLLDVRPAGEQPDGGVGEGDGEGGCGCAVAARPGARALPWLAGLVLAGGLGIRRRRRGAGDRARVD